jgi:hypothetical protein
MELFAVRIPAYKGDAFSKILFVLVKRGRREYLTLSAIAVGTSFLVCMGSDGSLFEATPSTIFISYQ